MSKLKYPDGGVFEAVINAYLLDCNEKNRPITLPGARLALGLHGTNALREYEKRGAAYSNAVKRLYDAVEAYNVQRCYSSNAAGAIFILKNLGYSDKPAQETQHVHITIEGKDKLL